MKAKLLETCRWFALCDKPAVTTQSHPILGEIPICQRCLDKYKALGGAK